MFTRHVLSRGRVSPLDFQPLFAGSSANVFKTVELGKAAAGATLDSDLAALSPDQAILFRTIFTTPPIASHPLAAHPRVEAGVREAVAAAVLAIGAEPVNAALLTMIRLAEPVRAEYERDYRPLEEVDVRAPGEVPRR